MMMRDLWKTFALSTVVGLGLIATAVLAQSLGTSAAFDSSLDSRSTALEPRSTFDSRIDTRSTLSGSPGNSNTGSIYPDGSLDPFRALTNVNARRLGINPLGSPYANGNANAYER